MDKVKEMIKKPRNQILLLIVVGLIIFLVLRKKSKTKKEMFAETKESCEAQGKTEVLGYVRRLIVIIKNQ